MAPYWIGVGAMRTLLRQIRVTIVQVESRCAAFSQSDCKEHASEKNFVWVKHNGSVPQTDTGGRVEKTKANE